MWLNIFACMTVILRKTKLFLCFRSNFSKNGSLIEIIVDQ